MAIRGAEVRRRGGAGQLRRDERLAARGDGIESGVDGAPAGTNSAPLRTPLGAYAGAALFIVALLTVNVFTVLHDSGPRLKAWMPFATEYTAALMVLAVMPAVGAITERAPPGRGRWLWFALVHLVGSFAFSAVVVGGFVLLRTLVFALMGGRYVFGSLGQLVYEYRKLALAYCGLVVFFHLSARRTGVAQIPTPIPTPIGAMRIEPEATFDIRDGARLVRVPVSEILSAHSAGNYVEFHIADGRRPLMRATLSSVEAALLPHGFLRTHRSWVVNPSRLRALEPGGSGDWRILLDDATEAPLSRRYPQALEVLRRS